MRKILSKIVCWILGHLALVQDDEGTTKCLRCRKYLGISAEVALVKYLDRSFYGDGSGTSFSDPI